MIRPPIEDVGGGQSVAFELPARVFEERFWEVIVPSVPSRALFQDSFLHGKSHA